MRRLLPLTLVVPLLLAGCGDAGGSEAQTDLGSDAAGTEGQLPEPGEDSGQDRPDPGRCLPLVPTSPGVFEAADAGSVGFVVQDGTLVARDLQPAPGWEAQADERSATGADVEFRRGEEVLVLVADVASDGAVAAELCNRND